MLLRQGQEAIRDVQQSAQQQHERGQSIRAALASLTTGLPPLIVAISPACQTLFLTNSAMATLLLLLVKIAQGTASHRVSKLALSCRQGA